MWAKILSFFWLSCFELYKVVVKLMQYLHMAELALGILSTDLQKSR